MQTIIAEDYYPFERSVRTPHETNPTEVKHVLVRINRGAITDSVQDKNFSKLYDSNVTINIPTEQNREVLLENIDGAVIGIEKKSIFCELFTSPAHRFVHLPSSLFPIDDISIGLPINISIDKSSGVRRPVISIRKLDRKLWEKDLKEFDMFNFE